jgi:hypothetical protein
VRGRCAALPPAPNDDFANAIPVASLPFTDGRSTTNATTEPGEPSPCGGIADTVWYSFTPSADASITANTVGSDYDTVMAAYTGTSLSNLTAIACDDQSGGGNQARISVAASAGTTIFFQVGGFVGATGNLTFNLKQGPPNDDLANATPVASLAFTDGLSTVDATTEPGEPAPCGLIAKSVWYSFTPGASITLTADTFGSSYDTILAAYTGTSLSNLTAIACTDQSAGTIQSKLSIVVPAGTTIFFQVGSLFGASGNLTFNLAVAAGTPPPNDRFANAAPVASLPFTVGLSTADATSEVGEPSACGGIAHTVWYSFTPSANVSITANTFGSNFDTLLAAYTGTSLSNLTAIACNDQSAGGNQSQISFAAAAGATVFFQVGGFFGDTGNLTLNLAQAL